MNRKVNVKAHFRKLSSGKISSVKSHKRTFNPPTGERLKALQPKMKVAKELKRLFNRSDITMFRNILNDDFGRIQDKKSLLNVVRSVGIDNIKINLSTGEWTLK